MYKITVRNNSNDLDNESYSFNTLPLFIDKTNNLFKELENQTKTDYLSVPPYRVIELPVLYIVGDHVKVFVYQEDSVLVEFE